MFIFLEPYHSLYSTTLPLHSFILTFISTFPLYKVFPLYTLLPYHSSILRIFSLLYSTSSPLLYSSTLRIFFHFYFLLPILSYFPLRIFSYSPSSLLTSPHPYSHTWIFLCFSLPPHLYGFTFTSDLFSHL
jgi:hypothetical protein